MTAVTEFSGLKKPVASDQTYLVTVAYDGTDYVGWQWQPNGLSVQQVLEDGFARITGLKIRLHAAGRTDAGVHALAMPADFTLAYELNPAKLVRAWNAVVPRDISVIELRQAPLGFSARFMAIRRSYRYLVLNRPRRSPFLMRWCWHFPIKLDIRAIESAVPVLLGEHDFTSFQAADCEAHHAIRRLDQAAVTELNGEAANTIPIFAGAPEEGLMAFSFGGSAFLKHQVRAMVGTLIEVGLGKISPAGFAEILRSADRRLAGPTAPAHGLTLTGVEFQNQPLANLNIPALDPGAGGRY